MMDSVTKERRAQIRAVIKDRGQAAARIGDDEILALLELADERDELRKARDMRPRQLAQVIFRALKESDKEGLVQCSPAETCRTTIDGTFNLRSVARRVLSALGLEIGTGSGTVASGSEPR